MQTLARGTHSFPRLIAVSTSVLAMLTESAFCQTADFRAPVEGFTSALLVQPDGRILAGGNFTKVSGQKRSHIARFDPNGTLDGAFNPGGSNSIAALIVQPDGKIVVGGSFTNLAGLSRIRIGRLNPDGSPDTTFNPGANGAISCLALQTDGKVLVGGSFTILGGQTRSYLGRLNADGSLDSGFNPGISVQGCYPCIPPSVNTLALQPDAKILVGGDFTTVGGLIRSNLARLNANGTLDTAFRPPIDFPVNCLAVQADGGILAGGGYNTGINLWYTNGNLVRIQSSGTLDANFNAIINSEVSSLALQLDGKILVGGSFTSVGGQVRTNIARLNPDGTLDTDFNARISWPRQSPQTIFEDFPLALQADGKILMGANSAQSSNYVGRLINTDPSTQSLRFDGSAITWLRGGTAPEAWRTSFEVSTDGATWANLGPATRISGGWQLSGLSLPANSIIRARAFLTGGLGNGSSWFVQSFSRPLILLNDGNFGFRSNRFGFNVTATEGQTIVVEGSINLSDWTPLVTNTLSAGSLYFSDPSSTNSPFRFYRARSD